MIDIGKQRAQEFKDDKVMYCILNVNFVLEKVPDGDGSGHGLLICFWVLD